MFRIERRNWKIPRAIIVLAWAYLSDGKFLIHLQSYALIVSFLMCEKSHKC